jgi:hypothetical protein
VVYLLYLYFISDTVRFYGSGAEPGRRIFRMTALLSRAATRESVTRATLPHYTNCFCRDSIGVTPAWSSLWTLNLINAQFRSTRYWSRGRRFRPEAFNKNIPRQPDQGCLCNTPQQDCFLSWGVVTIGSTLKTTSCRLPTPYSLHSQLPSISGGRLLHPQSEDVACRRDRRSTWYGRV